MLASTLQGHGFNPVPRTNSYVEESDSDYLGEIVAELILKNQGIRFRLNEAKSALRQVEQFLLDCDEISSDCARLQQVLATLRKITASNEARVD